MKVADAERGLADAVQAVLDRLDGVTANEVEDCRREWAAVVGATEEERRICEFAASLGIDPFDPEDLTEELEDAFRKLA